MAKLTELIAGWFRPRESDENEFYDDEPVQANDTPTQSVEQNPITQTTVAQTRQPVVAAAPQYQPPVNQSGAPQYIAPQPAAAQPDAVGDAVRAR